MSFLKIEKGGQASKETNGGIQNRFHMVRFP